MSANILIITNPVAGLAQGERRANRLRENLESSGWNATIVKTDPDTDAHALLENHAKGHWDAIAAVGGDGTLQEVVTGLLELRLSIPVLFVPSGTANVVALTLGLPFGVDDLADLVKHDSVRELDVGCLPDHARYLLLMATIGFPAEVVKGAPRELKKRFGFLAYFWAAVRKGIGGSKSSRIRITVDGETKNTSGSTVFVANLGEIPRVRLSVHPHTDPRDGKFDVAVVETSHWWRSLVAALLMLFRRHRESEHLWFAQGKEVEVDSEPAMLVQIDGELVGPTPVRMGIEPRAVSLFAPSP